MEAVVLVDVLRRAGAEVTLASVEPQLEVEASGGIKLVADTDISTCSDEIFDLVALPGGMPGSARLRDWEALRAEEKRLCGAICAAPAVTLLPWGLLRKKKSLGSANDDGTTKKEFNPVEWSLGHHTPSVLLPVAHGSEEIEVEGYCRYSKASQSQCHSCIFRKGSRNLASRRTIIIADMLINDAQESEHDLIILPTLKGELMCRSEVNQI